MKFGTIQYMEWHKTRDVSSIDLCRSGISPRPLADLDLQMDDLELSGDSFYGYPPLLEAISRRFGVDEENIVSTLGTSQGLFLTCSALLSPGDRIVSEKPTYEPVVAVPGAFETEMYRFDLKFDEGWRINPNQFEASLPAGTKLVVFTNLHNPTGWRSCGKKRDRAWKRTFASFAISWPRKKAGFHGWNRRAVLSVSPG